MFKLIPRLLEVLNFAPDVIDICSIVFELLVETAFITALIKISLRLGRGLTKRKIQIVGDSDAFAKLKAVLLDTGLFQEKNVIHVGLDDVERIDRTKLAIVNYGSVGENGLKKILERIPGRTELLIYCDPKDGKISSNMMSLLSSKSRIILTNFRGRLANDILTSLMVLPYDEQR